MWICNIILMKEEEEFEERNLTAQESIIPVEVEIKELDTELSNVYDHEKNLRSDRGQVSDQDINQINDQEDDQYDDDDEEEWVLESKMIPTPNLLQCNKGVSRVSDRVYKLRTAQNKLTFNLNRLTATKH